MEGMGQEEGKGGAVFERGEVNRRARVRCGG